MASTAENDSVNSSGLPSGFENPRWENHTDAFVLRNVLFPNGKLYRVCIEKPGTEIPRNFEFFKDDLLEIQDICGEIMSRYSNPAQYEIFDDEGICQSRSTLDGRVEDLTHDPVVPSGIRKINNLISSSFRVIASPDRLMFIPSERIVNPRSGRNLVPAESEDPTVLSAENDYEAETPEEAVEEPGTAKEAEEDVDAQDIPVLPEEREPDAASIADDATDGEEDVYLTPRGGTANNSRVNTPEPTVPNEIVLSPPQKRNLIEILDKVMPYPGTTIKFSHLHDFARTNREASPIKPTHDDFVRLLKNPKDQNSDKMREWLNLLINEAFDYYFTAEAMVDEDIPEDLTVHQYRGELAARWVIALLARSETPPEELDPLVKEMNTVYVDPLPTPVSEQPAPRQGILNRLGSYFW